MKKNLFIFLCVFCFLSCKGNDPELSKRTISVSKDSISFVIEGGTDTLTVFTNAKKWKITSNASWLTTSVDSGVASKQQITINVASSYIKEPRTAQLTITGQNADTAYVTIKQLTISSNGTNYPDYSDSIPPDITGMTSDAKTLAGKIYVGWNLGNSLEVPTGETGWGNPIVTQTLIDSVKAAGFNAVRIPCAWDSHLETGSECKIKAAWLARVKEVVDYCYNNNMYVILNIHWDGGWLENNPTYSKQSLVNSKQRALWEQIATTFKDYDEHLLFAGTNEVHLNYNAPSAENIAVQQSYLQTFVTAVRSTGGKNYYRNLIVQSYNTNIDYAKTYLTIPTDPSKGRIMVEVHDYDPWDFCGQEEGGIALWGAPFTQYGTISSWGQEDYLKGQFAKMKSTFVDKGYPVILGEYGAVRRSSLTGDALTNHLNSRAYFLQYITTQAKNYGLVPFYWDNGVTGNYGFGLFYRSSGAVFDKQALKALTNGASAGTYPFQ